MEDLHSLLGLRDAERYDVASALLDDDLESPVEDVLERHRQPEAAA